MRPDDDDAARVWDMVEYGRQIIAMVTGKTFEQYATDRPMQLAVERCIEIIGEAAAHLSKAFQAQHEDVPWREIIGQRNVIAHGYSKLDHDKIWLVATVEIPRLVERLSPKVSDPPDDPEPEA